MSSVRHFFDNLFSDLAPNEKIVLGVKTKPFENIPCDSVDNLLTKASFYQSKYNVHFTFNATNGGRFSKDTVRINAIGLDIDPAEFHTGESVDDVINRVNRTSPLPLHAIIKSGNGMQGYFFANGIPVEDYKGIARRIIHFFGGDTSTCDPSRYFRIPGSFNFKMPQSPKPCIIVYENYSQPRYSKDDLLNAFPEIPESIKTANFTPNDFTDPNDEEMNLFLQVLETSSSTKKYFEAIQNARLGKRSDADATFSHHMAALGFSKSLLKKLLEKYSSKVVSFRNDDAKECYLSDKLSDKFFQHDFLNK